MSELLERGRESYRRRAWGDSYQTLSIADRTTPLGADDLELLATSAYLVRRERDYLQFLERAHRAHLQSGDRLPAARCAFWLGFVSLLRSELGQATAWLARARRLVEGCDCAEQGYLLLPAAEQRLAEGDGDAAQAAAAGAAEVGRRFRDAELIACARHVQGRAFLRQGQVRAGLSLLDEAMLEVIRGELSPIVTGLVYCSVIDACQEVFALSRAREWTSALDRWCKQQPELLAFAGTCLVHRAEILQLHGAWTEAIDEARRAGEHLSQDVDSGTLGAAHYRQAEIHRLRGDFAAAEEAFRYASRSGREPQPGLALLRLAQGRGDAASAAIRRLLSAATGPLRRARLLPAYVEIMLAGGDIQEARSACRELEEIAEAFETDVLQAMAEHARGAVELASGESAVALVSLARAFEMWQKVEVPYEAARVRVLLAMACRSVGDDETCELELAAARIAFDELRAVPELARIDTLAGHSSHAREHGLTPREIEVLRRVAAGKTNKSIASELRLSERTIDRHVSNILTKLDAPSRTAAAAYAYKHRLV